MNFFLNALASIKRICTTWEKRALPGNLQKQDNLYHRPKKYCPLLLPLSLSGFKGLIDISFLNFGILGTRFLPSRLQCAPFTEHERDQLWIRIKFTIKFLVKIGSVRFIFV